MCTTWTPSGRNTDFKDKGKDTQYISNDNCKGSTRMFLQQSGTDDKSLDKDNEVTVVLI